MSKVIWRTKVKVSLIGSEMSVSRRAKPGMGPSSPSGSVCHPAVFFFFMSPSALGRQARQDLNKDIRPAG